MLLKRCSSWLVRALQILLTCSLFCACSGASWEKVEIESPYQAPKSLTIAIVARRDMKAAAEALGTALVSGLESRDIRATVVPEAGGSPDVTVSIVKWDPGSRSTRWLTSAMAGKGEVQVTVDSLKVDGMAKGWVRGGFLGGPDESSAEAVGKLIAKTIATGLSDQNKQSVETKQNKPSDY